MTMDFNGLVNLVLEQKNTHAKWGIVFRKKGGKDVGCCIGVKHGKSITLSNDLLERIKNIPNLKFYAEGVAAKDYSKEPGMVPFIEKNNFKQPIQKLSWDEITENKGKGTANLNNNIVYVFMQHEYNKIIDQYTKNTKGTMLDALSEPRTHWPKNSPKDPAERKKWLTRHMKKAGFFDRLNQPYNKKALFDLMTEMELSVYPKGQQYPDTSTYFGKMQHLIEEERNQTIYNLMGNGGCCFAGSGHLIELKQQFTDLEIIDEDNI